MIMRKIEWHMKGAGDSLILTLIGEVGFLTLIGGIGFLILCENKEKDIQILMSFLIIFRLLMGVKILSQPYFGSRKLIICLTQSRSSAASDVYKRQLLFLLLMWVMMLNQPYFGSRKLISSLTGNTFP